MQAKGIHKISMSEILKYVNINGEKLLVNLRNTYLILTNDCHKSEGEHNYYTKKVYSGFQTHGKANFKKSSTKLRQKCTQNYRENYDITHLPCAHLLGTLK